MKSLSAAVTTGYTVRQFDMDLTNVRDNEPYLGLRCLGGSLRAEVLADAIVNLLLLLLVFFALSFGCHA